MTTNRAAPHSELLKALEDYIALQGGWTLRIAGSGMQRRGSPDMACFISVVPRVPISFFLEAKTGRAVQTTHQRAVQQEIDTHGGLYFVVHSVDELEDVLVPLGIIRHRLTDRKVG